MAFSSTGYIGLAIGGCLLLCVIILAAIYCWKKKTNRDAQINANFLEHKGNNQAFRVNSETATNGASTAHQNDTTPPDTIHEAQSNHEPESEHETPPQTDISIHKPAKQEVPRIIHNLDTSTTLDTQPATNEASHVIKEQSPPTTHKAKPESMRIMLNDETLIHGPFSHQSTDTSLVLHETDSKGSDSASATPPVNGNHHDTNNSILIRISENEAYTNPSESSPKLVHPTYKQTHPHNQSSTLDPMVTINGRSSVKIHCSEDSFNPDADFTNHEMVDGNHGFGPSVQIHDDVDLNEVLMTDDTLPVDTLPQHYLSDSVESLDPDFVLEAAYFEESSVYSSRQQPMDSLVPIPMDDGGSTEWSMPGISIDHTASIQMLESMQMLAAPPAAAAKKAKNALAAPIDTNTINQSIQLEAVAPPSKVGKSIEYEAVGKSIEYESAVDKSVQMAAAAAATSMGGEQFIMWQMHGRKLKNMSHEELVEWLENSGFDGDTLDHFRKYKIDGRKLWRNIRNASMFLYNVGVVRPTLRDAIVQNIYLELLPKTAGFDERHIGDFKRLELIADGPISTVYRAVIKKEALKLRESIVVIKGYHFTADDVRVGKIIQILVHLVTNICSSRFVKIHGFIRNMMDDRGDKARTTRAMFGIVMEYCDGGSIHSMFRDGRTAQYNREYNMMDKIGIVYEIALAMSELHKKNTLHRNLKASNVLVSNNDDIKLTDYCLDVTQLTDFTHSSDAKERSIRWMSPELIQTQTYSKACDVYSFGILCYEILSGNKPYHRYNHNQTSDLLRKIINDNLRPTIDDLANLPDELLLLMTECWTEHPTQRPDFEYILDELDKIKHELRTKCITFDDIYKSKRSSSLPLLIIEDADDGDDDPYLQTFDRYDYHKTQQNNYDENDRDDEKFQELLAPYNDNNRPTHVKDDSALEKIKNFEPNKRRRKKKRPRKPLPKAPPVKKQLPQINVDHVTVINDKEVQLHDKPLPPKPI